jgi:hypothetical protein
MPSSERGDVQLLQFSVPRLEDVRLAVTMQEVVAIARLANLTPVPFAAPYVFGLSEWQDAVLAVIDLGGLLSGFAPGPPDFDWKGYCLIVRVVVNERPEVIAWPILPGASAIVVPPRVPRTDIPQHIPLEFISAAMWIADAPAILLDMAGLIRRNRL